MAEYFVRRLVILVPMFFMISIITFFLIQLPPGDYLSTYIRQLEASGTTLSQAEIDNLSRMYGLDQPLYVQYLKWMRSVFQLNFGWSLQWQKPVVELIMERLPMTLLISVSSLLVVWILAIPIAIVSATNQYSLFDYVFTFLGFVGLAMPAFLLALAMGWVLYLTTGLTVTGLFSQQYVNAPWSMAKVKDLLSNIWFPILIVGLSGTAGLIRTLRATLLDELRRPYVTTARAKGLAETRLLIKYPIRIAMNPIFSTIGWLLPDLINGGVIVGIVLNLQTIGPVLLRATLNQDMYLAGSILLILAVLTMVGTFISDILLAWLDPRIRYEAKS
jgi:peptide/nickel transport system permease protein